LIDRDERDQLGGGHQLEALRPQGGVMAAVMADLVERRPREEVRPSYRAGIDLPGALMPAQPTADLRVGRQQDHTAAVEPYGPMHGRPGGFSAADPIVKLPPYLECTPRLIQSKSMRTSPKAQKASSKRD
jgi:hypothetical protein